MKPSDKKYRKFLTFSELLIVISIIIVLSAVVFMALDNLKRRARDARRMEDLEQIRKSLMMYHHEFGDHIELGSGCGHDGNGSGWFNLSEGTYRKSIADCLVESKYLPDIISDPSGDVQAGYGDKRNAYIKYTDTNRTCIFAKLETLPMTESATDQSNCPNCDIMYGMNYFICLDK